MSGCLGCIVVVESSSSKTVTRATILIDIRTKNRNGRKATAHRGSARDSARSRWRHARRFSRDKFSEIRQKRLAQRFSALGRLHFTKYKIPNLLLLPPSHIRPLLVHCHPTQCSTSRPVSAGDPSPPGMTPLTAPRPQPGLTCPCLAGHTAQLLVPHKIQSRLARPIRPIVHLHLQLIVPTTSRSSFTPEPLADTVSLALPTATRTATQ